MDDEPQQQPPPPAPPPPSAPPTPAPGTVPPPPPGYVPPPPPAYGAPQGPYGAPPGAYPPGYAGPPRTEGNAVAALVLSILALFVCGIVVGVIALVLANNAKQKIVASGGQLTGLGMVTAARVIAIIAMVVNVAGLALLVTAS
jgi:hypothetical protein